MWYLYSTLKVGGVTLMYWSKITLSTTGSSPVEYLGICLSPRILEVSSLRSWCLRLLSPVEYLGICVSPRILEVSSLRSWCLRSLYELKVGMGLGMDFGLRFGKTNRTEDRSCFGFSKPNRYWGIPKTFSFFNDKSQMSTDAREEHPRRVRKRWRTT